jgi:hypothetical protein
MRLEKFSLVLGTSVMMTSSGEEDGHSHGGNLLNLRRLLDNWRRT